MKRLLILTLALVTLLALAAPAGAKKPEKPEVDYQTCEELGWESEPGVLLFGQTDGCEDVASSPGATFTFEVSDSHRVYLVLGVPNSVPGDWCDGDWTIITPQGERLDQGRLNALLLRQIEDGMSVELAVDAADVDDDGNCLSDDGTVHWNDDSSDWVVTAMGRIPGFKDSITIPLSVAGP
jgi:hypothetical protein